MLRIAGLVFVMVLVLESCWAQKGEGLPATTNIPGSEFPRINNDLSATFRVQADHAQKVQLLMEFGQSTYDMVRGAEGWWEVTTKPLLPGFHYYAVSVDGFVSNDPGSRTFFAARKRLAAWKSRATIRSSSQSRMSLMVPSAPSGIARIQPEKQEEFLSIRPLDMTRVPQDIPCCTFSTAMGRTKPGGATRVTRTSFSTI